MLIGFVVQWRFQTLSDGNRSDEFIFAEGTSVGAAGSWDYAGRVLPIPKGPP